MADGLARRQRGYTQWGHREAERIEGKPAPTFARTTLVTVALSEANSGTSVRMRADMEPATWLKGLLMRLIATRRISGHYDRWLKQLASAVTSES